MIRRPARTLALLSLVALVNIGCEPATNVQPDPPPAPPLSYDQLRSTHNARIADVDRLWARSVVEVRWTDDEGRGHFEQGDGPLIVRKPDELALAIGKLGNTRFWLGCDGERYWLFDVGDKQRLAYVGRQDNIANARRSVLPLPIQPTRLIGLLDITPLPDTDDALVTRDGDDHLIVLPPDDDLAGLLRKIRMDAKGRITEIELMDGRGRTVLLAELSRFQRMPLEGRPPGAHPWLAGRIHIIVPRADASVTLFIHDPSEGAGRIKDKQFDFDALTRALKIDRVVDVDRAPDEARAEMR